MNIVGLIIGTLLGALVSGFVIWVVGKLGWGIEVRNFGSAFVAAIVITILNGVVGWLLGALGVTIGAGVLGAVIHLVIAGIVLMLAGNFVKGLVVKGFTGAVVAALAIAAVGWLIAWGLAQLV
jgi:putative membrane protein